MCQRYDITAPANFQHKAPSDLRALVLDDSRAQCAMLSSLLGGWGYDVVSFTDPRLALECLDTSEINLVISDWVMPEMSGPEFCRRFREMKRGIHGYVILLTSKSEKSAIAQGLDAGADDFLAKPVHSGELRARINAGERILAAQAELREKNRMISGALGEIQTLYAEIERDLQEAKRLQESLLRDEFVSLDGVDLSFLLQSSGHVGGDLVGHFQAGPDQVGVFSIDVSGHGVTSAMIAARLYAVLGSNSPSRNLALKKGAKGPFARPLGEVASKLNELMIQEVGGDQYFTLCLAIINLSDGVVHMVQAGHPHPVLLHQDGSARLLGKGGLPIGLMPDASWNAMQITLKPGERLLMYSDGLTECPAANGTFLDEDGLIRILTDISDRKGLELLGSLKKRLADFAGQQDFPDDISAALIEFKGVC